MDMTKAKKKKRIEHFILVNQTLNFAWNIK